MLGKELLQGAAAIAIVGVGIAIVYFFYSKAQVQTANAASVALNNQYFQQQTQQAELSQLVGTINGQSASSSTGIVPAATPTTVGNSPS